MRIRDDGSKVIFTGPYNLKIGPDNGIYFYDDFRLHKFDENGKFVFKIVEPGQGPGEAAWRTNYFFFNDEIRVQAGSPPKIMRFDYKGKYIGEKRTEMTSAYNFLEFKNNKIYGMKDDEIGWEGLGTGYFNFPYNIYEVTEDFRKRKKMYSFPVKHYVYLSAWWPMASFIYTFKDNTTLYVVHTPEYKIIEFDLEKNKIHKIIDREYKRIKYVPPKNIPKPPPNAISPPDPKYHRDIRHMLIYKNQLWIFTSTIEQVKGRLIDIYNMEGRYTDNFYLRFPKNITPINFGLGNFVTNGEYIYSIDEHEDGYFSIAKYRLSENLLR